MKFNWLSTHGKGGTCDRCGKGIVNVAVVETENGIKTYGLDCVALIIGGAKLEKYQRELPKVVRNTRELAKIKTALKNGRLSNFIEYNQYGDPIYYWIDSKKPYKKNWIGLKMQNQKDIRKEIWEIVTNAN